VKPFSAIPLLFAFALGPSMSAQPPAAPASKSAYAPLPDIATLLNEVQQHEQQNELAAQDYIYNAAATSTDAHGRVKQADYELFFINGVSLARMIARNGQPLSADEAAKENARVDKAIAAAKERKAKAARRGETTDSNGYTLIPASRLLQLSTFTHVRRETLRGRTCIAFDFTGRRDAKTSSIAEAVLKSVNGTAWIDEQDHQIARITATFPETFRIGWGLVADVSKGSTLTANFAPVRDGVWLPLSIEDSGHARILLFDDVADGSRSIIYSNYRRFGSSVNIVMPVDAQPVAPQP